MSHDEGLECRCVTRHVPEPQELQLHHIWPLYAGGPDTPENIIPLCPTSHANVHELIRHYDRHKGEPPWPVCRRYSPFIRDLAERGWRAGHPSSV